MKLLQKSLILLGLIAITNSSYAMDVESTEEVKEYQPTSLVLRQLADAINTQDKFGQTLLHLATTQGNKPLVRALIESGANLNSPYLIPGKGKYSPLDIAAEKGFYEIAEELIKKDALLSIDYTTPLHRAAASGHVDIINLLLDNGAKVNSLDKIGQNPLHYAASNNQPQAIKALMAQGGNALSRDNFGNSPISIASQKGNRKAQKAIISASKKR